MFHAKKAVRYLKNMPLLLWMGGYLVLSVVAFFVVSLWTQLHTQAVLNDLLALQGKTGKAALEKRIALWEDFDRADSANDALWTGLKSPDPATKSGVLNLLLGSGRQMVFRDQAIALLEDADDSVRYAALNLLGDAIICYPNVSLDESVVVPRLAVFIDHTEPTDRSYVAAFLGFLSPNTEVADYISILLRDKNPKVRRAAIGSVERWLGDGRSVPEQIVDQVFEIAVNDEDKTTSRTALECTRTYRAVVGDAPR